MHIEQYQSPCTKLKYKWIKNFNINPATLNLTEDNVGSSLELMDIEDHFLNISAVG